MAKIKIEIPSEFSFVRGARVCISNIAYNFGFSDREAYQIETVVDEVCNNAIEYGGAKDKGLRRKETIKLECDFRPGKLELRITDGGKKRLDLKEILKRNRRLVEEDTAQDNLGERGRGLIIVKSFVDGLDIETNEDGTTVKMVKKAKKD